MKKEQWEKAMQKEKNLARQRSFGQNAIAFYLSTLEEVTVEQEVLVDESRRFRVDIAVRDHRRGAMYAIEHDSERYHSTEGAKTAEKEKDELMRKRFDRVIHVRQCKSREGTKDGTYSYREGSFLELEAVIQHLIGDLLDRGADVDIRRDTMRILREKGYCNEGRREWNPHILDRLEEDWREEDNAGFRLSEFSPGVYYHGLWTCKFCGNRFYAAICNRVKGDVCTACKDRRKKVAPRESFAAIFPDKARNWSEENDRLPTQVSPASGYLARWQCAECGHRWQTEVNIVARGRYGGCQMCGRERARRAKYKQVEQLDPRSGAVLRTYDAILHAKQDGFPKVDRAIKEGKEYKGFRWRLREVGHL